MTNNSNKLVFSKLPKLHNFYEGSNQISWEGELCAICFLRGYASLVLGEEISERSNMNDIFFFKQ